MRRIVTLMVVFICVACLYGCDKESGVAGTWYNTMDPEDWIMCTEDGQFSEEKFGGTYSFENGVLVLYYGDGTTEMFTSGNENEEFVLYDKYGDIWMNDHDKAVTVWNDYCEKKFNEELSIIPGKWVNEGGFGYYEFKEDGTYDYVYDQRGQMISFGDKLQQETGTWSAKPNGGYTHIVFNVETSNVSEPFSSDSHYPGYVYELYITGDKNNGYSIENNYYKQ